MSLKISLLGPPVVEVDDKPIEVDTRKAIALLAYLAVEPGASRDTLAAMLWAESPPDRARATLRRTLSSLRSGVGTDAVIADRNRIAIGPGAWIDLGRFDDEIAATKGHGHDAADVCAQCLPHLTRATELYRGDFLEGFSVRDAPEFEDWSRNAAESLRRRLGGAFDRLATGRAAVGDYEGAIAAVHRWIALDELHEPAHRLLMLLNAWSGNRPGAVQAYRDFVGITDRELGVSPLEETRELYEAILDEDLPPAPGVRRRVRAEPLSIKPAPPEHPLTNRTAEVATLRGWWDSARVTGRVGVVTGGPWMGKTRLVEDLSRRVTASDHRVLTGRAFRTESGLPYGVVTQILRSGETLFDSSNSKAPDWALEEISRLMPGHRTELTAPDRFGDIRLLEGLYETLATAASDGPILIVVDDVQWVDPASAGLLGYLGRRVADLPVLLLLVLRQGELVPSTIIDLVSTADRVTLQPLTVMDLDGAVSPDLAPEIVARTGGVPLLVQEWIEDGQSVDGSLARYLEARLDGLSDLARQVLSTTAVLAGTCDFQLLREVSGRSEDEVVTAIEELVEAGLMRDMPDGLGITLDPLEHTVYEAISLVRRRLLHRRAAETLASRALSRKDVRIAAATAAQFLGAGDNRAGEWFVVAGDLARMVYANEEARSFLESAEAVGGSDPAHIRLSLGELAMARGDYPAALQELTMAAALTRDGERGVVEHRLGELHRLLGRFEMADEHFALAASGHPEPALVYADWAMLHWRLGDESSARVAAKKALRSAETAGDSIALSRAENVAGVVSSDPGRAMAHLDRALHLAGDDEMARMAALNNKAYALGRAEDTDGAMELVEQAITIAESTGHRHREAALRNHLADLHHRAGHSAAADKEMTRAMELFAGVDAGAWEPEVWLLTRW